jgi:hypothetical protein
LVFECGSKLTQIDSGFLSGCASLESICLPASLQMIDGSALAGTQMSTITAEEGNRHFQVSGDFLLDLDGISVIRYFGSDQEITLSRHVKILGSGCFSYCRSLQTLTFEPGSKLTRIEDSALKSCFSLASICLPASLETIDGSAFAGTQISTITVESGNRHFRVSGAFLLDFEGTSLIRYFGRSSTVT